MIYTVGHKESYDRGFQEFIDNPQDFMKMGQREGYVGGSVWELQEQAQLYIDSTQSYDFEVYGVLADWDKDTEFNLHDEFNNLLIDAQLVKL